MNQDSYRAEFGMLGVVKRFRGDRKAVTAVEYCIIAGIVAVLIVGGVTRIGTEVEVPFTQIAPSL